MKYEEYNNVKKGKIKYFSIYKLLAIFTLVLIILTINNSCFANNNDENQITNDFELSSYSSIDGDVQYGVYVKKDEENMLLSIKAADYDLPSNLYDYKDDIRLRITYSQADYKVLNCKVINYKNGEIIEDLSEENINKLFNVEYGKKVTEKNWFDVIKLSELKQNEFYKYTANSKIQFPEIENDIGKNCIIYIKQKNDKTYEKKINMYKEISYPSLSFNEYNSGESFTIMYKEMGNEELLKLIKEDEIIYLSNYKDGDELEYQFEKYIYNDTEKNIIINTKFMPFGVEMTNTIMIGKGEICGFDCGIDSAIINYSKDVNNEEQNEETPNKDSNQTQAGNKINIDKLPATGEEINEFLIVLYIIVGISGMALITLLLIKRRKK